MLKDDKALLKELHAMLTARVKGNPYSSDGSFAKSLSPLPPGLRAMGATHWLDISLTLDSITWHFGNFGEPGLVAQTEEGLQELGLEKLAGVFRLAKELMIPLIASRKRRRGREDPSELLDRTGNRERGDDLDRQAWALTDLGRGRSFIYEAWVRYARHHPERVFGD